MSVCNNDPYLMNSTAVIFWLDLKREKAANWFERSLLVDSNVGDTWAYYYFLHEDAKDEPLKQEILRRCVQAEPSEGRLWRSVSDRPSNWSLSTDKILMEVVEEAKKHFYSLRR